MKKIFSFIVWLGGLFNLCAQSDQHLFDSSYIIDKSDAINLATFISVPTNRVSFSTPNAAFNYQTNQPARFGFNIAHKWISFSFKIPQIGYDADKGKTSSIGFDLLSFGRLFNYSFSLGLTKGYYLSNATNFPIWNQTQNVPYYIASDMQLTYFSGSITYNFNNKKFSYQAVFNNNQIQKRSAGSLLLKLDYAYNHLSTNESIIPLVLYTYATPEQRIKNLYQNRILILPGYTHTFVFFKKYFFNVGGYLGISYLIEKYNTNANVDYNTINDFDFDFSLNGNLGYMGERFYWGLNADFTSTTSNIKSIDTKTFLIRGSGNLYWGMRISVPKKAIPISNMIEKYSPTNLFLKVIN